MPSKQRNRPRKGKKRHWREFERLVAQIERSLAASGVVIKSPDEIADAEGNVREVDASIRSRVGSADILILV